jgi:hypothetical protein
MTEEDFRNPLGGIFGDSPKVYELGTSVDALAKDHAELKEAFRREVSHRDALALRLADAEARLRRPAPDLRDMLAAAALSGLLADHEFDPPEKDAAETAYRFADAMLAARLK